MSTQQVSIIPCDSTEHINIDQELLKFIPTINNMIVDIGGDLCPIPLSNVNMHTFNKIIEYLKYRIKNPLPKSSSNKSALRKITDWEKEYCPQTNAEIFELILAVNYLDIKELLELLCRCVAYRIRNLTAEEIRVVFNIENDFTPEEEERVIKENDWVEKESTDDW